MIQSDKESQNFKMSTKPGPEWRSVIRRKTISMNNGTIIEDINITPELTKAFLTRKLPDSTQGRKSVLYCNLNKAGAGMKKNSNGKSNVC